MKRLRRYVLPESVRLTLDYVYVLFGSAVVGLSFNLFLLPNKIASGGVSGISTLLKWAAGFEPSYVQWALNIPLFLLGVWLLGDRLGYWQYALKTLTGTLFLAFVVYLTADVQPATNEPLLGALFGGLGIGLGLGIVFRGRASTGGTDLAAQIVHKYTGASLGGSVAVIDGMIVLSSALIFGIEEALYALIGMYLTGKTVDVVQVGFGRTKMALIITNRGEALRPKILQELDRGMTQISAVGGYTSDERPIFMCVVSQNEVAKLKRLIREIDPRAFVIVTNASEVLGEGFKQE